MAAKKDKMIPSEKERKYTKTNKAAKCSDFCLKPMY